MKYILQRYILLFIFAVFITPLQAQEKVAREVVGISGESIYHKYQIEFIGNKKDTIRVFDSAAVLLPLQSDYYFIRVHRTTSKGEKKEYKVKEFNMVVNLDNDSSYTQQFSNKYIDDPLLSYFKRGQPGNVLSVGNIMVLEEGDRMRNVGSYQLIYR